MTSPALSEWTTPVAGAGGEQGAADQSANKGRDPAVVLTKRGKAALARLIRAIDNGGIIKAVTFKNGVFTVTVEMEE